MKCFEKFRKQTKNYIVNDLDDPLQVCLWRKMYECVILDVVRPMFDFLKKILNLDTFQLARKLMFSVDIIVQDESIIMMARLSGD